MVITDWPLAERPRERLLSLGASSLSDAELLAIFLRTGTRGLTAVDLARRLLKQFGGLRPLLQASHRRFCEEHGLGTAKYAQLQAALEMGRRHLEESLLRKDIIAESSATCRYLTARLRSFKHEVFACLFLDTQNQVLCFEEISHGSIDSATIHPREVAKRALKHNAAGIILAHNHPSGVSKPSQSDRSITETLRDALALVEVRVIDHIIIGEEGTTSLARLGWI